MRGNARPTTESPTRGPRVPLLRGGGSSIAEWWGGDILRDTGGTQWFCHHHWAHGTLDAGGACPQHSGLASRAPHDLAEGWDAISVTGTCGDMWTHAPPVCSARDCDDDVDTGFSPGPSRRPATSALEDRAVGSWLRPSQVCPSCLSRKGRPPEVEWPGWSGRGD